MELKFLILVCFEAALLGAYYAQARSCERPTKLSGIISYSLSQDDEYDSYTTPGYDENSRRITYAPYDYTRGYNTRGYDYTGGYNTRRYDYTTGYNTRRYDYTTGYNTRRYHYTTGYNTRRYDYSTRYNTPRYGYTTDGYYTNRPYTDNKCWIIRTPQESYVRLSLLEMNLRDPYCDYAYLEVEDNAGMKTKICQRYPQSEKWSGTFLGDVTVTVINRLDYYWRGQDSSFKMEYHTESVACARNDSFRCSKNQCIYPDQVCDGRQDCDNGIDEQCNIPEVRGVNATRIQAINWLKNRQTNSGWGRNTHRAITALYLSGATKFRGTKTEDEIMVKELQLKAIAALLRKTTSPLSVNELSMYVNSLMVTCHDLRNFYGYDLLKMLSIKTFASSSPSPGAYLTLCNAGWQIPESSVPQLIQLLEKDSGYPFGFEIQAMTVMALSCIRQKTQLDRSSYEIYNSTIKKLMVNQKNDGSFGNAHTTAIVSQALNSSGIPNGHLQWDYNGAVKYLIRNFNSSSVDFLSVYLSLPIFDNKTLLDIGRADCSGFQRKFENDDDDVSEIVDRMGGNTSIQYSLYIGNNKEVVQTIHLKVPEKSTALDVMKLAQMADHKYKFSFSHMQDHVYIYKIGGMSNDMEVGKFWLHFKANSNETDSLQELYNTSPDQIVVNSGDHLIMWYKMADF